MKQPIPQCFQHIPFTSSMIKSSFNASIEKINNIFSKSNYNVISKKVDSITTDNNKLSSNDNNILCTIELSFSPRVVDKYMDCHAMGSMLVTYKNTLIGILTMDDYIGL